MGSTFLFCKKEPASQNLAFLKKSSDYKIARKPLNYRKNAMVTPKIGSTKGIYGAPTKTRTRHNRSEDDCDIHFTMGAWATIVKCYLKTTMGAKSDKFL